MLLAVAFPEMNVTPISVEMKRDFEVPGIVHGVH